MTRLRWASGIALVALTTTACGMGGGRTTTPGSPERAGGGGHLVYAEQFPPAAGLGDRRPMMRMR